jgi:diguanylate cyclase (GGDEF)-like protein
MPSVVGAGLLACLLLLLLLTAAAAGATTALKTPAAPQQHLHFDAVGGAAIPRGVVAALAQDSAGFLWIATGDGLVRHDGYRFRPQQRESPLAARRNLGWVRALLGARDGRVWIGTEADGLAVYDPATDRVTIFGEAAHADLGPPAAPAATIRALAEDRDGAVWIGSLGGGLDRLDPSTGRRTAFRKSAAAATSGELPDDRVLALLVDRQGTLWVGSWQGLSRRRAGSQRFEAVLAQPGEALGGHIVQSLFEASDGRIWVGTQRGDLLAVDPATGMLALAPAAAGLIGAVTAFTEAPRGRLWVGRTSGIDLHDAGSGVWQRSLRHDPRRADGLAGNEVTALLQDHAGGVWVGGLGLGLQRHNPLQASMVLRSADVEPGALFSQGSVRSVLARREGDLWVAPESGGLLVMDAALRVTGSVSLPSTAADAAGASPRVQAMAQARDGSIWLAAGGGLHRLDALRRPRRSLRLAVGEVYRLLAPDDGSLWVCAEGGLYRLAPGAAGLQRVAGPGGVPFDGAAFVIAQAPDRSLWVGGANGLHRIAPGTDRPEAVPLLAGAGLGNPVVIGLLFDRSGGLWVDTAVSGLHHLQPASAGQLPGFDRVSERHGRVGRPFGVNLLEDARGRIWTQQHVYDPASDRLDELTEADGKHFGTGWFHAYAQAADGRLLFGGSRGLLVVSPERFEVSNYAPRLVLADLHVNGVRQPVPPMLQRLQVAPQQRSFSLEFAALDYSDPARIRYAYRLAGFDPEWIQAGADARLAAYSNLDPGHYELQLRATNRSGVWSPHERAVAIDVLPAWWQRSDLRAAAGGLALAAVWALVQLRTRVLRKQRLRLEIEVAQRTAELEASSLTDPLTGMRNRRFLAQQIPADVAQVLRRHAENRRRPGPPGATADVDLVFFLIDIDHFKQVNDEHGHAAGDAVLVQMHDRLLQAFRQGDHLVRWGGEEFLVAARHTSREGAAELAERVRSIVVDTPFVLDDGRLLTCSCSVGFAAFPLVPEWPLALDWAAVVGLADAALYAVKRSGRNGWLGLLRARAECPDALRAAAAQPLVQWQASGGVDISASRGVVASGSQGAAAG